MKRAQQQLEQYRAKELSRTTVEAEIKQRVAEGQANALKTASDAKLYSVQRKAEGQLFEQMKIAESKLYTAVKEAEGKYENMRRQAEGLQKKSQALRKLVDAYGNPHNYIMSRLIDEEILVKIAKQNASAIHGLNPKITVWSGDANDAMNPIKNLAKNIIPAMDIVRDQTGYSLPDWIVKKPKEEPQDEGDGKTKQ